MKKSLCKILGIFICLLMFPLLVNADVGMPESSPYDVVITKKEGVEVKDSYKNKSVVIPYDTKVTVNYEYYDDETGILYGYVEYEGVSGEISLKDVKVLVDNINLNDFEKLDTPGKLYVFGDEAYLFAGPSQAYGKVKGDKKIPAGEVIEYQYFDGLWVYTEYEGVKGWVFSYTYFSTYQNMKPSTAYVAKEGSKVLTIDDITELQVSPLDDKKIDVKIPKNEEIEYKYYFNQPKVVYFYVEYKGVSGWLKTGVDYDTQISYGGLEKFECNKHIVIDENITVYKTPYDETQIKKKKMDVNTEFTILYFYNGGDKWWYKIEYGKDEGWISGEIYNIAGSYNSEGYIYEAAITEESIDVYEKPSLDAKKVGALNKDEKVDLHYKYDVPRCFGENSACEWHYIKNGNISGWIADRKYKETGKKTALCPVSNNQIPEESEPNESDPSESEPIVSEIERHIEDRSAKKKLTPAQMAIIGVGGAIVLALVCVVTIKLVNKKKKVKDNNNQIEETEVRK